MATFDKGFSDAKKLHFEKRQSNAEDKRAQQRYLVSLANLGLCTPTCSTAVIPGSTSSMCRYLLEDMLQCCSPVDGQLMPFLLAIRKDDINKKHLSSVMRRQKKQGGHGGVLRKFNDHDYFMLTGRLAESSDNKLISDGEMQFSDID